MGTATWAMMGIHQTEEEDEEMPPSLAGFVGGWVCILFLDLPRSLAVSCPGRHHFLTFCVLTKCSASTPPCRGPAVFGWRGDGIVLRSFGGVVVLGHFFSVVMVLRCPSVSELPLSVCDDKCWMFCDDVCIWIIDMSVDGRPDYPATEM